MEVVAVHVLLYECISIRVSEVAVVIVEVIVEYRE